MFPSDAAITVTWNKLGAFVQCVCKERSRNARNAIWRRTSRHLYHVHYCDNDLRHAAMWILEVSASRVESPHRRSLSQTGFIPILLHTGTCDRVACSHLDALNIYFRYNGDTEFFNSSSTTRQQREQRNSREVTSTVTTDSPSFQNSTLECPVWLDHLFIYMVHETKI